MISESKIVLEHTVNWGALGVYSPGISLSVLEPLGSLLVHS